MSIPRIVSPSILKQLKANAGHANRKTRRDLGNPEEIKPFEGGFRVMKPRKERAAMCKGCNIRPRAHGSSRCQKCTDAYRAKQKV